MAQSMVMNQTGKRSLLRVLQLSPKISANGRSEPLTYSHEQGKAAVTKYPVDFHRWLVGFSHSYYWKHRDGNVFNCLSMILFVSLPK